MSVYIVFGLMSVLCLVGLPCGVTGTVGSLSSMGGFGMNKKIFLFIRLFALLCWQGVCGDI